jgi:hypothetical protein
LLWVGHSPPSNVPEHTLFVTFFFSGARGKERERERVPTQSFAKTQQPGASRRPHHMPIDDDFSKAPFVWSPPHSPLSLFTE